MIALKNEEIGLESLLAVLYLMFTAWTNLLVAVFIKKNDVKGDDYLLFTSF